MIENIKGIDVSFEENENSFIGSFVYKGKEYADKYVKGQDKEIDEFEIYFVKRRAGKTIDGLLEGIIKS